MRAAHKEVNMEQTFKIGDEQWERLNDANVRPVLRTYHAIIKEIYLSLCAHLGVTYL